MEDLPGVVALVGCGMSLHMFAIILMLSYITSALRRIAKDMESQ